MPNSIKSVLIGSAIGVVMPISIGLVTYGVTKGSVEARLLVIEQEVRLIQPYRDAISVLQVQQKSHEDKFTIHAKLIDRLAEDQQRNREESIKVAEALNQVAKTQHNLSNVVNSLEIAVTRLEVLAEKQ